MTGSFSTAVPLIIIGLVLLVIAIWLIMRLGQSTTVVGDESIKRDVLDEGAAPAQRNQALIDAKPAAIHYYKRTIELTDRFYFNPGSHVPDWYFRPTW